MKLRFHIAILLLLLIQAAGLSAQETFPAGGPSAGMSGAFTAVNATCWAALHNPAALTGLEGAEGGAFGMRRFMMKELNDGAFVFAFPFMRRHYAAVDASGSGFSAFSYNRLGISYATDLIDHLSLGIRLNASNVAVDQYGSAVSLYADLGLRAKILPGVALGFSVQNINQAEIGSAFPEKLPTIFALGLAYEASDKVLVTADLKKRTAYVPSFSTGVRYEFNRWFTIRLGVTTQPVSFSAGFGFRRGKLLLDFSHNIHQVLGHSPGFSFTWKFSEKSES